MLVLREEGILRWLMNSDSRSIDVFFYGLFMDEALLRAKGLDPQNRRLAKVENFKLVIGERATLVPSSGGIVHGVLFTLTEKELDSLYSEASLSAYQPEPVTATTRDEIHVAAFCFNLPAAPARTEYNPQYVAKLKALATQIGLPAEYVATIA